MCIPVEPVTEKILDLRTTERARWQADTVQYDEFEPGAGRTRIAIRADAEASSLEQPGFRVHAN